ncbi:polysaccharide biosynthesis protein, partial [Streptomyces sp. SID10244]|nr:polysaccharide biosynthesis protein [Streptomyces sp. SID10244]
LGAAGYAVFAVFWAAYGMVTGTQNGQLQETTRTVRAALDSHRGHTADDGALRARPWLINTVVGLVLAAAVAATSPLWSGQVFTEERWPSVLLLSAGVASFAVYAHLAGALSGALAWGPFAVLLSVDALVRLVGAVVAVTL